MCCDPCKKDPCDPCGNIKADPIKKRFIYQKNNLLEFLMLVEQIKNNSHCK